MKSLADALPPEIAQQIHPDWRKNEEDYQSSRDGLLDQYRGQWIAFDDGAVIAAASAPLDVFLAVQNSGRHPFVIRVGHEDEPWYHIRRASFAYDTAYPPTALPVLSAEFRSTSGTPGSLMDQTDCDIQSRDEADGQEHDRKLGEHDQKFNIVFEAVRQLMAPPPAPKKLRIAWSLPWRRRARFEGRGFDRAARHSGRHPHVIILP